MLSAYPAPRMSESNPQKLPVRSPANWLSRALPACSLTLVLTMACSPSANGQANVNGKWQTLPTTMPINPVHVSLLHNGKILVVSGSGNLPSNLNFQAAVWDPASNTVTPQPFGWDMFCNGMAALPDGRILIAGGNLQYDPFH